MRVLLAVCVLPAGCTPWYYAKTLVPPSPELPSVRSVRLDVSVEAMDSREVSREEIDRFRAAFCRALGEELEKRGYSVSSDASSVVAAECRLGTGDVVLWATSLETAWARRVPVFDLSLRMRGPGDGPVLYRSRVRQPARVASQFGQDWYRVTESSDQLARRVVMLALKELPKREGSGR